MADSTKVGKADEDTSVKHKAYVPLREIFRDACKREPDPALKHSGHRRS